MGVALLFLLVTLIVTYPLPLHLSNALAGAPGDNFENLFRLRLFADSITAGRAWPLTTPNVYYPFGYDLRYGDTTLINLAMALPIILVGGDVFAFNWMLVQSFVLCGLSAYLFARLLTHQHGPAIIAGLLYAFSAYRVYRVGIGHFNHFSTIWIPLVFLYIELAIRRRQMRWGALAGLSYALTGLATWNNAAVVAIGVIVYGLARTRPWGASLRSRQLWRAALAFVVVVALMLAPAAILMLGAHRTGSLGFSLAESDAFSGDLFAVLAANPANPLSGSGVLTPGFVPPMGWMTAALAALALWRKRPRFVTALGLLAMAGIVLTWGPTLHWNGERVYLAVPAVVERLFQRGMAVLTERIALYPQRLASLLQPGRVFIPLPAYILALSIPFFNALREWANFMAIISPAVAALAAWSLAAIKGRWRAAILAAVAVLALLELLPMPFAYGYSETQQQPLVQWLRQRPDGGAVARFPIVRWTTGPTLYDGYTSGHPFVDGYAPYQPAGWRAAFPLLENFPSTETIAMLRRWQVKYVIVSPVAYGAAWSAVEQQIAATPGLQPVASVPYLSRFRAARLLPSAPASPADYVPVSEWLPQPSGAVLDTLRIYELAP